MLRCCQETGSATFNQYEHSETILHNSLYQQQCGAEGQSLNAPKMNISLDLPGYDMQYLPTYWPGQKITGEVKIQLGNNSPIKVSHLRIALFGNVQVYGSHPGKPMTNGLFDYHKDEQLINTGLRIVRRVPTQTQQQHIINNNGQNTASGTITTQPENQITRSNGNSNGDEEMLTSVVDERRWRLHCRRDERVSAEDPISQSASKRSQKTPEDRHIERLIRKAAAIDHVSNISSGILVDDMDCFYREETSSAFEMNTTSSISFSIRVPTSRRLSSTFDHPHYPITYRVVAIMKIRDKENNEITCFSTVRLRLESTFDINASQYTNCVQSNPTRHYVQSSNNLMNGVCTYILSSSSILTHWLHKMTQQSRRISPSYCSSYIQSHLEMSKQAFERSQHIPIKLNLSNNAAPNFRISAIKIYVDLIQKIDMTCSMNEEVERKVIRSSTVLFKSVEEEECEGGNNDDLVFFKHANMIFDLSKLIQVPDDCTGTITAESTRNVFTLGYNLNAKLEISGVAQPLDRNNMSAPIPIALQEMTHYYYASDKHVLRQELAEHNLPKEPYHQKLKTYSLQLEPLTVIIGNSNCLSNDPIYS